MLIQMNIEGAMKFPCQEFPDRVVNAELTKMDQFSLKTAL
jgi:hypothetical protein